MKKMVDQKIRRRLPTIYGTINNNIKNDFLNSEGASYSLLTHRTRNIDYGLKASSRI